MAAFVRGPDSWQLQIAAQLLLPDVKVGDSVAVNGCCLTVVKFDSAHLWFDVLEETRRLTNFTLIAPGTLVNLERSLRADSRLGGHFVTGHVDTLGRVGVFEPRGKDHYLKVAVPEGFSHYLVYKGSVAIDGISLTVAEVAGDAFAVWLIPHTLAATNLRSKKNGDMVNLEFDLLAKYVRKITSTRPN